MTKPRLVLMKGTDLVAEDGTVNEQAVKDFVDALWGEKEEPKEKKKDDKGKGTGRRG